MSLLFLGVAAAFASSASLLALQSGGAQRQWMVCFSDAANIKISPPFPVDRSVTPRVNANESGVRIGASGARHPVQVENAPAGHECNAWGSRNGSLNLQGIAFRDLAAAQDYVAGMRTKARVQVTDPALSDPNPFAGTRTKVTVSFRTPRQSNNERGFVHATTDVEYQVISCFGELHLAYSLVPGSTRLRVPNYLFDGRNAPVTAPAPQVATTSLSVRVYNGLRTYAEVRDDLAAEALGFGCFTGQSKPIGMIRDLVGPNATPTQIRAFIRDLDVDVLSNSVLTSAPAEAELRAATPT